MKASKCYRNPHAATLAEIAASGESVIPSDILMFMAHKIEAVHNEQDGTYPENFFELEWRSWKDGDNPPELENLGVYLVTWVSSVDETPEVETATYHSDWPSPWEIEGVAVPVLAWMPLPYPYRHG